MSMSFSPCRTTVAYLNDSENSAERNTENKDQEECSVQTGEPPRVKYRKQD